MERERKINKISLEESLMQRQAFLWPGQTDSLTIKQLIAQTAYVSAETQIRQQKSALVASPLTVIGNLQSRVATWEATELLNHICA